MSDDYELDDLPCPTCASVPTHSQRCTSLWCDDGTIDETEYDPIEGETAVRCETCHGAGIERWCPQCGCDISLWIAEHPAAAADYFKQHDAQYDDDPGLRVAPL